MDEQLNYAPCGFLTFSTECRILSINQTLLGILENEKEQLLGHHINSILSNSAQVFFQLYFLPIVIVKDHVAEMYLSLLTKSGVEVPVLINASMKENLIECVVIPIQKRNEYENQLRLAKKVAEDALKEKKKANYQLETTLKTLETKQKELLEANMQNQKYKLETQEELRLAKKVQETLLTEDIINEEIQIESYYKASSELSGDIYGFYQINENQYGVILLDVMGHGISSALITMSLHSLFHRLISKGVATDYVMKELDSHLHSLFINNEDTWHYCTAIYLFIDTAKQTIEYINAGHPPAIYQEYKGEQQELSSSTPPLGSFKNIHFKTKTMTYTKGSKLLLYTDGVSDPLDLDHLPSLLMENSTIALSKLKEKIINTLTYESTNTRKNDDQCFILIDLK